MLAIGTNEGRVLLFETEGTTQQLEWRAHGEVRLLPGLDPGRYAPRDRLG
ncbi:MAG: hypothetical protein HOP15_18730 [Planctomycetes bacterium]|nr:hypothetical protein [Planctomycetota bacterium]